MSDSIHSQQRNSEFDATFRSSSPLFYFHHIIDPKEATLRVEVIGPNLVFTFTHELAKKKLSPSEIASRLERKTVGFLSLVAEGGNRRIVLAWAESGHGVGRLGDLLDAGPSVLSNEIWTRRAIAVGKILAIKMGRPFDNICNPHRNATGILEQQSREAYRGIYAGAHVEVKLAVHAIFVLLSTFNITQDLGNVQRQHLRMLRGARWEDGTRPAFEIYFSRKSCGLCMLLVRKLEEITGVRMKLIWRDRLVRIVYDKTKMRHKASTAATGTGLRDEDEDEDDIEVLDDETMIADDVVPVDYVDLTGDYACSPTGLHNMSAHGFAEIINLINEEDDENAQNPSSSCFSLHQKQSSLESFIDGLAYCVGQIDHLPDAARIAIIELARIVLAQRRQQELKRQQRQRRAAAPTSQQDWTTFISKPLPATPVTQPPWEIPEETCDDDVVMGAAATAAVFTPPEEVEDVGMCNAFPQVQQEQSWAEALEVLGLTNPNTTNNIQNESPSALRLRRLSKTKARSHSRRRSLSPPATPPRTTHETNETIRQRSPRCSYSVHIYESTPLIANNDDDVVETRSIANEWLRRPRTNIRVKIPARRRSLNSSWLPTP